MNIGTREFRQMVGSRIKAERERKGLTQKDFAKMVGLSNQTYNNLENGLGSLKIEHLYQIKEKCGCDIGYLLGECEERTYIATDICKEIGLSEHAVTVLREGSKLQLIENERKDHDFPEYPGRVEDRRRLIDFLILDSEDCTGLMGNIIGFMGQKQDILQYKEHPAFARISEIIDDFDKTNLEKEFIIGYPFELADTYSMLIDWVKNILLEEGYSEEEIEKLQDETDDFFSEYRGFVVSKDILKGSLQNRFAKYIDKYLFEV